jgi:predicted DNA-binding protein
MGDKMKVKRLNVRLTDKRYEKINLLAKELDRTVSSLVDEWIDSLSTPKTKSHGE